MIYADIVFKRPLDLRKTRVKNKEWQYLEIDRSGLHGMSKDGKIGFQAALVDLVSVRFERKK